MRDSYHLFIALIICHSPLLSIHGQFSISLSGGIGGTVTQAISGAAEQALTSYTVARDAGQIFDAAFGTGISTRLRMAYAFSRHISVDVDASFLSGLSKIYQYQFSIDEYTEHIVKSPRLGLNPAVVLNTGWRVFAPYVRLGVLMPGIQKIRASQIQQIGEAIWEKDIHLKTRNSFGWNMGVGMTYKIHSRIKMFYEFEFLSQRTSVRQANLVNFVRDDQDLMPNLNASQTEVRYRNILPDDANRPQRADFDPDKPLDSKSFGRNTSSITANLGVVLSLN